MSFKNGSWTLKANLSSLNKVLPGVVNAWEIYRAMFVEKNKRGTKPLREVTV